MSIYKKSAEYDIVVVGGGLSGMCAAVSAARQGVRTAIVQNRSMFGGTASSEIRMHICGANCHSLYVRLLLPLSPVFHVRSHPQKFWQ